MKYPSREPLTLLETEASVMLIVTAKRIEEKPNWICSYTFEVSSPKAQVLNTVSRKKICYVRGTRRA